MKRIAQTSFPIAGQSQINTHSAKRVKLVNVFGRVHGKNEIVGNVPIALVPLLQILKHAQERQVFLVRLVKVAGDSAEHVIEYRASERSILNLFESDAEYLHDVFRPDRLRRVLLYYLSNGQPRCLRLDRCAVG